MKGLPLALTVLATGCGMRAPLDELRVRAAYDLKCPRSQLEVTELRAGESMNYGVGTQEAVNGCGHRAVYIYHSGDGWIMNSAEGAPVNTSK